MMSDDFHKFFDRTTRLMERAMCEDHQSLFVDYTGNQKSLVSKLNNNLDNECYKLGTITMIYFFFSIIKVVLKMEMPVLMEKTKSLLLDSA